MFELLLAHVPLATFGDVRCEHCADRLAGCPARNFRCRRPQHAAGAGAAARVGAGAFTDAAAGFSAAAVFSAGIFSSPVPLPALESTEAGRATGAFFGAGDTGTGFLTGAALAAGLVGALLSAWGRSAGRRTSAFRATGLAAGGFLALADLGAGRLAAISRSSKAVWLVKDAGLYRPTSACKRG